MAVVATDRGVTFTEQNADLGYLDLVQNGTKVPENDNPIDPSEYPVAIVSILLSLSAFYILLAQVTYCILRRNNHKTLKMTFNILCTLSSFFTFCRVGVPHLKHELVCGLLHDFEAVAYPMSYALIWTTLWLRQYYFYNSPSLRYLYSLCLRVLSISVEVLIVALLVVTVVEYFATRYVDALDCIHDYFEESEIAWIATFIVYMTFQALLLGLLVYPLYKHRNTAQHASSRRSQNSILLDKVVIRAVASSAFCICLDLTSLPLRFLLDDKYIALFLFIMNVNLVVQLIAVIASFKSWKSRFFPWRECCFNRTRQSSAASNKSGFPSSTQDGQVAYNQNALRSNPEAAIAVPYIRTVSNNCSS